MCMSVPDKYKNIGDFHEYYSGQRVAPYLTIFCGGNHEAGNYLFELYYGGWVAPNIYYMGAANVLNLGPLRIAGVSGIWKGYDYRKPHFERLPYNIDDVQSIYHIRELDVRKLLQLQTQVDVGISHDWPNGIELFGDTANLFRRKKHLRDDSAKGTLGSKAARHVLDYLRPAYWFSAHLHVRYALTMPHGDTRLVKTQRSPNEPEGWAYAIEGSPRGSSSPDKRPSPPNAIPDRSSRVETAQEPISGDSTAPVADAFPAKNFTNTVASATGTTDERLKNWNTFGGRAQAFEQGVSDTFRAEFKAKEEAKRIDTQAGKTNTEEVDLGSSCSSSSGNSPPSKRRIMMRSGDGSDDGPKQSSEKPLIDLFDPSEPLIDLTDEPAESSAGTDQTRSFLPGILARPPVPEQEVSTPQTPQPAASESLRSKLPGSLARRPDWTPVKDRGPKNPPAAVKNKVTKFMALDKPNNHEPFVELVELNPISANPGNFERPLRLRYDKEWLAITRAFAHELQLGDPKAVSPTHLGDEGYSRTIQSAASWIEDNVVRHNLLEIPENFEPVAPFYNPAVPITTTEAPLEYPNPQTAAFCQLVGIDNKFKLTDEERDARIRAGARPNSRPDTGFRTKRGTRGGANRKHGRKG